MGAAGGGALFLVVHQEAGLTCRYHFPDSFIIKFDIYFLFFWKQTGEETFFKIKKSTKMQKVFETYAQRKGVQVNSLRFMLDGERIDPTQTPKMLELDDQDQIDCLLEQVGGVF